MTTQARGSGMTRILLMMMVFIATIGANANAQTTNAVLAQVPFAKQPSATRYAAGQLRAEHIKALVDADVRRVIDLTTARETPDFDGRAAIEQAGMIYAALPIDGKGGLTRDNVRAFDALLSKAGDDITLVHCSSANRVGALVALRAAWIDGATPEQAIAEGERWGLKGLRDTVALQLAEGPTAGHAATARTPFPRIAAYGGVVDIDGKRPDRALMHKIVIDAASDETSADGLNGRLELAARTLNLYALAKVPPEQVEVALVVHGKAVPSLFNDAVFTERFGKTNPDAGLLQALLDARVSVVVCGQALAKHNATAADLRPGVTVSLSAITELAERQASGFALIP